MLSFTPKLFVLPRAILFCFVSFMFQTVPQCQETLGGLFVLKNQEMKSQVGNYVHVGERLYFMVNGGGAAIMPESPKCQNFCSFALGFQYPHQMPLFSSESSFHSFEKDCIT